MLDESRRNGQERIPLVGTYGALLVSPEDAGSQFKLQAQGVGFDVDLYPLASKLVRSWRFLIGRRPSGLPLAPCLSRPVQGCRDPMSA